MKPLELSAENKEHLLEMAKYFFPEIFFAFTSIPTVGVSDGDLYYYETPNARKRKYIHWFEFATTSLSEKIFEAEQNDIGEIQDFISDIFLYYYTDTMHPIEYLYQEYLKLKK